MRQLFDSRMDRLLVNHWQSTCVIQTEAGTVVTGMEAIPCRIGPIILTRPTDDEVRTDAIQEKFVRRDCKLSGYFPQITPRRMKAVVDGVVYPIRGIEHDSALKFSRLRLEIVNP